MHFADWNNPSYYRDCYPAWSGSINGGSPGFVLFNKWLVTSVTEKDLATAKAQVEKLRADYETAKSGGTRSASISTPPKG